jgi:hypothetical protein
MIVNGWMTEKTCQFSEREKVLPLFTSVDAESGYLWHRSGVQYSGWGLKMTNQSNLRQRLWSSGVIPPLPDLPSWCAERKFGFAFEKIVENT